MLGQLTLLSVTGRQTHPLISSYIALKEVENTQHAYMYLGLPFQAIPPLFLRAQRFDLPFAFVLARAGTACVGTACMHWVPLYMLWELHIVCEDDKLLNLYSYAYLVLLVVYV